MQDIINLIVNNGMGIVLMAYFLYKDSKQSTQIVHVLSELRELMAVIKEKV